MSAPELSALGALDLDVRLEWGEQGVSALAGVRSLVVVDVLSFSTCVDIAAAYAERQGAVLAGSRGEPGPSLSPASLLHLQPGTRLVLPSPNGSSLSCRAEATRVYAACLRNAHAVAAALEVPVGVLAAGERWPDGSLRPALEDVLGAGALVDALLLRHPAWQVTPEARAAAAAFREARGDLPARLRGCRSGLELLERGFPEDVALAAQLGVSGAVPRLAGGAYRDACSG